MPKCVCGRNAHYYSVELDKFFCRSDGCIYFSPVDNLVYFEAESLCPDCGRVHHSGETAHCERCQCHNCVVGRDEFMRERERTYAR